MLKLMKYEWRKQWFSKLVMMGVLAILVIAFILCSRLSHSGNAAFVMALMYLTVFSFCIYSGIEAVVTFHRDLKSRQSYLLFMIPQPAWKVLAAKVLTALLTMLFTTVLSAAAAGLCLLHEIAREGMWHELYNAAVFFLEMLHKDLPDLLQLIPPLAALFFQWFFLIVLAFLTDTAIMTVFSGFRRGAGLLGIVCFLLLAFGSGKLFDILRGGDGTFLLTGTQAWLSCGYYAVLSALIFAAACIFIEKKLSV